MTLTVAGLSIAAILAAAVFIARFLGSSTSRPRVDYCDELECMQSGKCQSGDCQ